MNVEHEDAPIIPIVEENLTLDKRIVETGRVNVQTFVDHEQVMLRDQLSRDLVDVERVAIGREVEVAPPVREEGDILIVPVLEERLVVEKRLFLVEELRLHRSSTTLPVEMPVTRRVMRAEITRVDNSASREKENE